MRLLRAAAILLAVALALLLITQVPFLYSRFWVYPRTQAALDALDRTRAPHKPRADGLSDFRGVMHVHTELSHDSMGTPAEIIAAARRTGLDFIFTTDHYGWLTDADVINKAVRGEHDGVLFVVGSEMRDGIMPFFLDRAPERYDPHRPLQLFVNDIRDMGGVVFLNHPDDPNRRWDLKGWTGMEIYNLHADARKARLSMYYLLSEQFWSMQRYPMRVFHRLFQEPRDYLRLWDGFTRTRRVVGIAGNDSHQNNGLRLFVNKDGQLVLADTSGSQRAAFWTAGRLGRALARARWGELTAGRTLWRIDADLYERSFRYVSTHLIAREKTEAGLREAVENGHAYIGFDSLIPTSDFDFRLKDAAGATRAIMGDEVAAADAGGGTLVVESPVSAELRVIRDGARAGSATGREFRFPVSGPGVYRAEVHLHVSGASVPWIYSNPIYIR